MSEGTPKSGWRVLWILPAFVISAYCVFEMPGAIYAVSHPQLRHGLEVNLSWFLLLTSPLVAAAVIVMVRRAIAIR